MRAPRILLLLAAALVSGCLTNPDTPSPTSPAPQAFSLDCSIAPGMGKADWPERCLALASPNESPSKAEVDIAVNPKDNRNIVVASKDKDPLASDNCVWSVAQVTKDGGKTWKTVYVGGDRNNRVTEARAYRCVTDPIMTFGADGTFYYALQIYDSEPSGVPQVPVVGTPGAGSAFILARSKDGGLTYDKYVLQAQGEGDLLFHDYPRMIENPSTGSIHTIWNAYTGVGPAGHVAPVVSSTRDKGETVAPPLVLKAQDSPTQFAFFSGFAATKDGQIYVTMQKAENSDAGETTTVWIWKSTDDAMSFQEVGKAFAIHPTPRQHGNHEYRTPSFVEMAVDQTGAHAGRIYLFWPEWSKSAPAINGSKDGGLQSDIMASFSDDGAKTWSSPMNIATEPRGNQYFMRPAVAPDGTVHVLFSTQAYSASELLDQVHAYSPDGGLTWSNERLTSVSFDGDKGIHQDGFPFIGDYNGLKVGPDGIVHAAWGDTATGRAEIAYARILPPA